MKAFNLKFRSEEGAAYVAEAIIVYPIVFLTVVLLLITGFTYVQRGYLNYRSQKIADYLAKCVSYPGYAYIERPDYLPRTGSVTIGDLNAAMKQNAPYRYLFGIFGNETGIKDSDGDNLAKQYAAYMAEESMPKKGYLKSSGGDIPVHDGFRSEHTVINTEDGYACAISATTSRIKVYMGQKYTFSRLFSMIGFGGRNMIIHATSTAAVSDSLEIVKTTDMGIDMAAFLSKKLGFDMSKVKTLKEIIQGK